MAYKERFHRNTLFSFFHSPAHQNGSPAPSKKADWRIGGLHKISLLLRQQRESKLILFIRFRAGWPPLYPAVQRRFCVCVKWRRAPGG